MHIQLETQPYASIDSDALVTYVFDKDDKFDGVLGDIDRAMNDRLASDGWVNLGRLMIRQRDKLPVSFVEIAIPSESRPKTLTGRQIRIMNAIESRTKSMLV